MTTWIGDLWLDHLEPAVKQHSCSILYVPGLHEGSWVFQNWLQATQAVGLDSWALNLRGHNGSRPVGNIGKVSIQDYAQDVLDVIAHLGNRVILVGHSLGGLIGLHAAAGNPNVAGLVLVLSAPPRGIFPPINTSSLKRYLMNPSYWKPFLLKQALLPHRNDMHDLVLNGLPEEARAETFQKLVPDSGLVFRQIGLGAVGINPRHITCPVLVVGATHDRLLGVGIQEKIAKKFSAQYKEFHGAHMLPIEEGWQAPIEGIRKWAADRVL